MIFNGCGYLIYFDSFWDFQPLRIIHCLLSPDVFPKAGEGICCCCSCTVFMLTPYWWETEAQSSTVAMAKSHRWEVCLPGHAPFGETSCSSVSLPAPQHGAWSGERLCPREPEMVCNASVQQQDCHFSNCPQESAAWEGGGMLFSQDLQHNLVKKQWGAERMCPTRPDVKTTMDHLNWFPMSPELKHKNVSFQYKLICERKKNGGS